MDELLTQFLENGQTRRGYSIYTIKGYRSDIRAFLRWLQAETGIITPDGITRAHIERYDVLQGTLEKRPRSRRRKIAAIRAFTGWLLETENIRADPGVKIKLPISDDPTRTAPTAAEKDALLDGCQRLRTEYRCKLASGVLACMFFAGLRPMEVAALCLSDIDLHRSRLTVQRGKGGKRREVPINTTLCGYLADWLAVRQSDTVSLFVTTPRRPLSYPILRLLFLEIKTAAGLRHASHLTAHCLRHWFASEMHALGTNVVVIQKLMGHENLNTTQNYIKVMASELDAAVRGLDCKAKPNKPVVDNRTRADHAARKATYRRMP